MGLGFKDCPQPLGSRQWQMPHVWRRVWPFQELLGRWDTSTQTLSSSAPRKTFWGRGIHWGEMWWGQLDKPCSPQHDLLSTYYVPGIEHLLSDTEGTKMNTWGGHRSCPHLADNPSKDKGSGVFYCHFTLDDETCSRASFKREQETPGNFSPFILHKRMRPSLALRFFSPALARIQFGEIHLEVRCRVGQYRK